MNETRPSEANDACFSEFFLFSNNFLHVPPFSPSLLPPRPSFLLVPLFLVQHCLNHLESVKLKVHFSSILTKALPTDGRTDGQGLLLRCSRSGVKSTDCLLQKFAHSLGLVEGLGTLRRPAEVAKSLVHPIKGGASTPK